jgi:hypothetical protein
VQPWRVVVVAWILGLVLVTAASGSGGAHPIAKRTFVAQAQRMCVHAKAQIAALPAFPFRNFDPIHPDPKTLVDVGKFFTGPGNEVPIGRSLLRRLQSLGTPPSGRRAWQRVLATFREFIAVIRREASAALRADVDTWVAAVRENRLLPRRLAVATRAFGAPRCAIFD